MGLVIPFVISTPVNGLCVLAFVSTALLLTRRNIKTWSQILGGEFRLVWGLSFLLNGYLFFPLTSEFLCFNR